MTVIRSRDNPKVKRWARLVADGRFRRKEGRAIIEGPHLLAACLERGWKPVAIFSSDTHAGVCPIVLSDRVFRSIVDAETPQGIAAEIEIPKSPKEEDPLVYLEGVQDPGNVGAIIRTAAAFGIKTVCLDKDCADPWSPKVLRAGMGGHFLLNLLEGSPLDFSGKLVCTVAKGGTPLSTADLSGRFAWVFGSEGRGVSPEVQRKAAVRVTIPTDAGTESLNVAAAAAICLYVAYRRSAA